MKFSVMEKGEESEVIELVRDVFDEMISPAYTQEGVTEFYNYASIEDLAMRSSLDHFTLLARDEDALCGIIEFRLPHHVSLFFVRQSYQNRGVGKALFAEGLKQLKRRQPKVSEITVNASLNAVAAYKRIGFVAQGDGQTFKGISFVPMKRTLDAQAADTGA